MADEASEQRQFIVQSMRKFALQTQTVEFYINNEITHIMSNLEQFSGHLMKIANVFDIATINGIRARIMTGYRFVSNDKILNLLKNLSKISGSPSEFKCNGFTFPLVAKWRPNLTGHNRMVEAISELHAEVAGILNLHMKTRCTGSPVILWMPILTINVELMTKDSSTFHMPQAQATVPFSDIFVGAIETINGTMEWILLFLARHQLMQKRLHAEIIEVIGNSPPSLSDRSRLPYTESVQHEVIQLSFRSWSLLIGGD
ncbi:unnamed protein product [Allacma fusca]|uniref:Cytochrome P450 n=1 Tax=Allacma fusca TaxID=39272 RepID=A0A8J2PNK8_9HEXA|nr:unnamed protein product [Allacma fusca]